MIPLYRILKHSKEILILQNTKKINNLIENLLSREINLFIARISIISLFIIIQIIRNLPTQLTLKFFIIISLVAFAITGFLFNFKTINYNN